MARADIPIIVRWDPADWQRLLAAARRVGYQDAIADLRQIADGIDARGGNHSGVLFREAANTLEARLPAVAELPEPAEAYPGQRTTPTRCPVCGALVDVDQVEVGLGGRKEYRAGQWACPNGCDPRTLAAGADQRP